MHNKKVYSGTKKVFIAHRREKDGEIQDLWQHLKETSSLAGKFASKIGLEKHGELIGLLHDLGKATVEFDEYIRSETGLIDPDEDDYVNARGQKGKIDHSSAGAQVIHRYFSDKGNESLFVSQILSLAIASHHSGLIDCLTPDGDDNFSRRMYKANEKTRTNEAVSNLDDTTKCEIEELLSGNLLVNQLNQKIKSIRENNNSFETSMFTVGLLIRFLFSCLIDADRLNTADFEFPENARIRNQGNYRSWHALVERLEMHLSGLKNENRVDDLRKIVSKQCLDFSNRPKGLYQLTVPTGGGKTLSSLRFALNHAKKHQMDRIIYVIPYTSIIDQNAQKAREILEEQTNKKTYSSNIVLEHHSNLTPEEENTKQKLLSENWDEPVVFTTMVQFMEAIFGYGTRNARRMHQLANVVLIFDEIQTLSVQCVHLFNVAVRFLIQVCGSTVVLCTATQPLLDKITPQQRALIITPEQQMMKDVQKLFEELKRVEVYDIRKIEGWTDIEVADLAKKELQETGSVLTVVNTKDSAINLYKVLQNHPEFEVFHLSTGMCPKHRMNILDSIKNNLSAGKPTICVSTQLIEAGVDIDFGTVIRYLAGLDSIAQAAGRCNRNGLRVGLGRVFIVNPKNENLNWLEDIRIGRDKAERVLSEYKTNPEQFDYDILGLKAMEQYYQYYFYDRSMKMCYPIGRNSKAGRDDSLFELLSANRYSVDAYKRQNDGSHPRIPLCQSFKTASEVFQAIDSSTRGIVVPYRTEGERIISELCGAANLEKQYKLLKEAQRYSVNVFTYMFDKLLKQEAIYEVQKGAGIFYLNDQYYSENFGISEFPVNEIKSLIVGEVSYGKQGRV